MASKVIFEFETSQIAKEFAIFFSEQGEQIYWEAAPDFGFKEIANEFEYNYKQIKDPENSEDIIIKGF